MNPEAALIAVRLLAGLVILSLAFMCHEYYNHRNDR